MRAVVAEAGRLTVRDVAEPTPGAGEVQVGVAYAGINFADLATREGIPGSEAAGEVTALGPGVEGLAVGDRVAGFGLRGTFAERAVGPAAALFAVPPALSLETAAAAVMQGITAYHCLITAGRLVAGDRVLVTAAAGGVGGLALQWARLLGAQAVYGVASTPAKRAHVLSLGADRALAYEELAGLGEDQVDLFLDSVGGSVFGDGLRLLAPFGRAVVYGAAQGPRAPLDPALLIRKVWTIAGSAITTIRRYPERYRPSGELLWQQLTQGRITVPLGGVFGLEAVDEAFQRMRNRQTIGKLLVKP